MKYDSLSHLQTKRLKEEYDRRHSDEIPQKPDFAQPYETDRKCVQTDGRTHLYVFMEGSERHKISSGYLRVVGSSEHIEIELPIDSIPRLIEQLQVLHQDMQTFDAAREEYGAAMRQYEKDKKAYEDQREKKLRTALASGKYTESMITDNPDDIPF